MEVGFLVQRCICGQSATGKCNRKALGTGTHTRQAVTAGAATPSAPQMPAHQYGTISSSESVSSCNMPRHRAPLCRTPRYMSGLRGPLPYARTSAPPATCRLTSILHCAAHAHSEAPALWSASAGAAPPARKPSPASVAARCCSFAA